jgi:hypothetical protein
VRKLGITAAVIVMSLLPLFVQSILVAKVGFYMGDFRAFYCAARVTSLGADPYRAQPLRSCELAVSPQGIFQKKFNATVPAPLPGYAIAFLEPLARLPFVAAWLAWLALLLGSWGICVAAVVRFANVRWEIAVAAFAFSLGVASIPLGEIAPLAIAATCAGAYFAWRGHWTAAALCAAVAMIEPHLGLPVCIALAVWAPKTRLPLAMACAVLASISVLAVGARTNLEYFTSVLPAHALSEASRNTQFSLTSLLTSFGVTETAAIRAGTFWYAGMLVAGTIVAGALARRMQNAAFLACVPPVFAVFGGTFVHITQIAVALPAALLLASYARAPWRAATIVALLLLAVPWIDVWSPALGLAPIFPVAYLTWRYTSGNSRAVIAATAMTLLGVIGFNHAYGATFTAHAHHAAAAVSIDPKLAEASWSRFAHVMSTTMVGITRLPTWFGLLLLLSALTGSAQFARAGRTRPLRYPLGEVS